MTAAIIDYKLATNTQGLIKGLTIIPFVRKDFTSILHFTAGCCRLMIGMGSSRIDQNIKTPKRQTTSLSFYTRYAVTFFPFINSMELELGPIVVGCYSILLLQFGIITLLANKLIIYV